MSDAAIGGNDTAQMFAEMQAQLARSRKEHGEDEKPQKILFGTMEVSPQIAGWAGAIWNVGLSHIRSGAERAIESEAFEKVVAKIAPKNAGKVTSVVADVVGWGMIAAKPIGSSVDIASNYMHERSTLTEQLAPVIKAEGFAIGLNALHRGSLANNEVVQLELDRIAERAQKRAVRDVLAEAVTVIPQGVVKLRDKEERKIAKAAKDAVKEAAKGEQKSVEDIVREKKLLAEQIDAQITAVYGEGAPVKGTVEYKQLVEETRLEMTSQKKAAAQPAVDPHAEDKHLISTQNYNTYVIPAASIFQKELQASSLASADKNAKEKTAFSMIVKMQDQMDRDHKLDAVDGKKLASYVKEIFEVHQKNMKRADIGAYNRTDLEYASQEIAHAISRGVMHPMALVHLVGEGMIVQEQGRAIATRAEVAQAITGMTAKMPAKYAVDPDKYFSEARFTEAEAKEMIAHLPPDARDMFLSLMPDEAKMRLGVSEDEIAKIHVRAKDQLAQSMQMMVFDMASRSDDDLKAQHLTDEEIKLVRKVADESKAHGVASVLAAVSTLGRFKEGIEFALVNDKGYWQSVAQGAHFGDTYHAAHDELYSERAARERTEKMVDERARKIIEERERKGKEGESHVEKYAAKKADEPAAERKHTDHVKPTSAAGSHADRLGGERAHAARDEEPHEKDTSPSLASKLLQQRQHGHTQRV